MTNITPDSQTPRQLLPLFYQQYMLGADGGQDSPWVKIEFTKKIALYFPNTDERRRAVLKHDIHHLATGYTSTIKGETEIGSWELGSGCRNYWIAFLLDLHAMTIGVLFNPIGVTRAFMRGRKTRNLYRDEFTDDQLMDIPLSEIKENMWLYKADNQNKFKDWILFVSLLLLGIIYSMLSLLLIPFIIIYTLIILLTNPK